MPLVNIEEEGKYIRAFNQLSQDHMVLEGPAATSSVDSLPLRFSVRTSDLFLGTGHSARSVYELLFKSGVKMLRKDFAVGLRLQISQKYINQLHFGEDAGNKQLGAAEFTLKHRDVETNRDIFTFCMCPGGVIVNASHGNNEIAVNGMSYSTRASRYANSAFVVPVGGTDFDNYGNNDALSGLRFQQHWERCCFEEAGGAYAVPAQRVVDYVKNVPTHTESIPDHIFMGTLKAGNLHNVLPDFVNKALVNGIKKFSERIPGIMEENTLLVGIESRTSAPVRIERDAESLESTNTAGLYPIGEGAGYAGGIMTACVDGVRAAEAMIANKIKSSRMSRQTIS